MWGSGPVLFPTSSVSLTPALCWCPLPLAPSGRYGWWREGWTLARRWMRRVGWVFRRLHRTWGTTHGKETPWSPPPPVYHEPRIHFMYILYWFSIQFFKMLNYLCALCSFCLSLSSSPSGLFALQQHTELCFTDHLLIQSVDSFWIPTKVGRSNLNTQIKIPPANFIVTWFIFTSAN